MYALLTWDSVRHSQPKGKEEHILVGKRKLKDHIFGPSEELYDLDEDPLELINLATEAKHKEKLLELRTQLDK